jgi:glucose-fructose oxidoreductase
MLDCILNDKAPEPSGREGLADIRIIQALLRSADSNRPVSMPQVHVDRRPNLRQEISQAPLAAPLELVRGAAPGAE